MILQALTQLYEDLLKLPSTDREVPRFGYSCVSVSAIAEISLDGTLMSILPANTVDSSKKKTFTLPLQLKRSGSVPPPYFLSDNAQYVFGTEKEGITEKSLKRFKLFKEFHEKLLKDCKCQESTALCNFLNNWNPSLAENAEKLANAKGIISTGQIIFRIFETSSFIHEVRSIQEAWQTYYTANLSDITGMCLVTGKHDSIARIHNSLKNIKADSLQPNGWSLVCFDKDSLAFSSYGKIQGENAPVSEYAAFAYTSALNYLLADRENVHRIGDTTVVSWAEGADPAYNDFFDTFAFGDDAPEDLSDDDLRSIVKKLANGLPCNEIPLDINRRFYILGLAPNAARLSVRFFYNSTFGELMQNVTAHQKRLEIVGNQFPIIPLWALLRETVNLNTTDKSPSPLMAGAVARAIFTGSAYPASLLQATMLRIRAERKITAGRAAILKAYYLKNENKLCPKEVLTVSLNEASTNVPYTLGRLFAVYEAVQEAANPSINATIKDKYFNSASATPAMIFPILDSLAQKHLRKLELPKRIYFDKQISKIKNILGEENPPRLSLPEQGSFNLGYYHQKEARYTKKEEK